MYFKNINFLCINILFYKHINIVVDKVFHIENGPCKTMYYIISGFISFGMVKSTIIKNLD
jgi:hypothetical protein